MPAPTRIELYLSGGGVRAALFSLGVLLYLVQSGFNTKVRVIVSVSGGSITNAAAALTDFSTVGIDRFELITKRLARRLASSGTFFLATNRIVVTRVFIFQLALWSLIITSNIRNGVFDTSTVVLYSIVGPILFGMMASAFIVLSYFLRSHIQMRVYDNLLLDLARDSPSHLHSVKRILQKIRTLGRSLVYDLPKFGTPWKTASSSIIHVLCATELTSGEPIFLSSSWTYSPAYGKGNPVPSVAAAVYSSAAFPLVFPPLRLPSKPIDFSGGSAENGPPSNLFLVDGGVHNNLGTDWMQHMPQFEELPTDSKSAGKRTSVKSNGGWRIIVNATAPPRRMKILRVPLLCMITSLYRISNILYDNTVQPRVDTLQSASSQLQGFYVLDIRTNAIDLVNTISKDKTVCQDRATSIRTALEEKAKGAGEADKYWSDIASGSAWISTRLSRVGQKKAANVVQHGYISAAVLFGLYSDHKFDIPDDRWFLDIVSDRDETARDVEQL
jgi:predicted acylesterase/phospholipase RssA